MPELPEVETMRRGIAPIVGGRIIAVQRPPCRLKPITVSPSLPTFRHRVVQRRVAAVERWGKRVVVRLDDRAAIVFEPRMTGLVLLKDPPDPDHLRFRLGLADVAASQLTYWDRRGLGSIRLLAAAEFQTRFAADRLGPDALQISRTELRQQLGASRRAIKVALLDQQALAGIGNLYASEILHVAGLHPTIPCNRLTGRQWQRLHTAIRDVLDEAIRYEGSTLADGTYRNALNHPGRYQQHHRVYAREAQPCPSCGRGTVQRMVQAQRATFFCPRCQARRERRMRPP